MTKKKIFFLTGIRSEYDILAPVIQAVQLSESLEAGVIVTGGHLTARMGNSISQIESDGFPIVGKIEALLGSDTLAGRMKGAGLQLIGMTDLFAMNRPDVMVVMGDREESMTGALAALYHHIPLAHIGGGDHADDGNVDNPIRHAVSKLAHLHFATTPLSGQRLRALGEEDWRINVVGASGLDRLVATPHMSREETEAALGVEWNGAPFAVLLYHPTITDFTASRRNIDLILEATKKIGLNVVSLMPNTDPGNEGVAAALAEHANTTSNFKLCSFLERKTFVNMMRHASVMLGNSSSGILEAPTLGLPVVNVGLRQRGREHAANVDFVDYDLSQVSSAIDRALNDQTYRTLVSKCETPYGNGDTSARIAKVLETTPLDDRLMQKPFLMKDL